MEAGSGNVTLAVPAATEEAPPEVAIVFVGFSLFLGAVCRQIFHKTPVPYTVALLLVGLVLGFLDGKVHGGLGTLGVSIRLWADIDPSLILFLFLPALLFESSFSLDVHQVKRCLGQMALLAGPGVLISTFALGIFNKYLFPYGWSWPTALLLGALLSATDPVAVVALLRELGASKKLSTIIEGESLLNDGTAIVVFRLFFELVLGDSFHLGSTVVYLIRVICGGVALGCAFGFVAVQWLGFVFNDTLIEITVSLISSYLSFYTAEAQAGVSGVLTVMSLGIFLAAFAKTAFTGENEQSLHYFWQMVAYIANTLIFILAGVIIAESIVRSVDSIQSEDWGYAVLLYIAVQVSRAVVVAALYPLLRVCGYGLNWKEAVMLVWSGLRGAVALSLALTVQAGAPHGHSSDAANLVPPVTRARIVFFTGAVVFLTLVVNGSTTKLLLRALGLSKVSLSKVRVLELSRAEMRERAMAAYMEVADADEELGAADWPAVQRYVTFLKQPISSPLRTENGSALALVVHDEPDVTSAHLRDARTRFLRGVQAAYWEALEEDRLTQQEAGLLMRSVDHALDNDSVLHDWAELRSFGTLPRLLLLLQRLGRHLPRRIANRLLFSRLELACGIAGGYLHAHEVARAQLLELMGEDSHVAQTVVEESKAEAVEASAFLESVRLSFPQVLVAIKTRQVSFHVLRELEQYVADLGKGGLLDEREIMDLHDTVQVDLKKLLRHPPVVEKASVLEVLRNHPLASRLSEHLQTALSRLAKERTLMRGTALYKEGNAPSYAFILANGVVKATSQGALLPAGAVGTFCGGATLGLYELLAGRQLLFTAVADSALHAFCLERSKIEEMLLGEPELSDFLWKEGVVALAKVLLGQPLEGLSMAEIRYLVTEESHIKVFPAGAGVELALGQVAILLTGALRNAQGHQLNAPAGIGPGRPQATPGPLDAVRLRSERQFSTIGPSRLLFIKLSTPTPRRFSRPCTPSVTPRASPASPGFRRSAAVGPEGPSMRRTYSDNSEATLSKWQVDKLKKGLLETSKQRAGGQSLLDLRLSRAPLQAPAVSALSPGLPGASKSAMSPRYVAGNMKEAALSRHSSTRNLQKSSGHLHHQELRRRSRPLLELGVSMPSDPGVSVTGNAPSNVHELEEWDTIWTAGITRSHQREDDEDKESVVHEIVSEEALFQGPGHQDSVLQLEEPKHHAG